MACSGGYAGQRRYGGDVAAASLAGEAGVGGLVSIAPGATAFTVMRRGPSSLAK
jgi:hypothetical protein